MTDETVQNIQETYYAAAENVSLPDDLQIVTAHAGELPRAEGRSAVFVALTGSGKFIEVAKHEGEVKQVHAERYLEEALADRR